MKNNTESKVEVHFKDIDTANRFAKRLQQWANIAGTGGDADLCIDKGDGVINCGFVGHDIDIKKIEHVIPCDTKS